MTKLNYNGITHTFISGKASSTLIIPINIARKYGLDKPTDVIIEELSDGILVKKINLMGVLKC
jgi:hypothetical protein